MSRQLKVGIFVIVGLALMMIGGLPHRATRSSSGSRKVPYKTAFSGRRRPQARARPSAWAASTSARSTKIGHDSDAKRHAHLRDDRRSTRPRLGAHPRRQPAPRRQQGPPRRQDDRAEHRLARVGRRWTRRSSSRRRSRRTCSPRPTASPPRRRRPSSKIEPLAESLGDPQLAADIKGSAADMHSLLDAMVHGNGTMHRLFFDHREARPARPAPREHRPHDEAAERDARRPARRHDHVRQGPGHRARGRLRRRDLEGHRGDAERAAPGPQGDPRRATGSRTPSSTATTSRST